MLVTQDVVGNMCMCGYQGVVAGGWDIGRKSVLRLVDVNQRDYVVMFVIVFAFLTVCWLVDTL